jgi:hypothetical protein
VKAAIDWNGGIPNMMPSILNIASPATNQAKVSMNKTPMLSGQEQTGRMVVLALLLSKESPLQWQREKVFNK